MSHRRARPRAGVGPAVFGGTRARRTRAASALALLAPWLPFPGPASAQLPGGDPGWPAALAGGPVLARGPSAGRHNPALLAALADPSGWDLAGAGAVLGLGPVTAWDLLGAPDPVPHVLRERWLGDVRREGGERGAAAATLAWATVAAPGWAAHLSTTAWGRARLDPDAAELILFGNAGLTGEPRELRPHGALDAALVSTLGLSAARRLGGGDASGSGGVRVGATLALHAGHAVAVGRDSASVATADPPTLALRFPLLEGSPTALAGGGVGLDLGAAWDATPWSAAVVAHGVVGWFAWRQGRMTLRSGEAVLGPDGAAPDDAPRPTGGAPAALLRALDGVRPPTALAVAVSRRLGEGRALAAELRTRVRDGIGATGPRTTLALGAVWRPRSEWPIRAGVEVGGGIGLALATEVAAGRWVLRAGGGLRTGGEGAEQSLGLSLGRRPPGRR